MLSSVAQNQNLKEVNPLVLVVEFQTAADVLDEPLADQKGAADA